MTGTRPVALTLGDPSGVGPELALAAWRELAGALPFFLIGDSAALAGPAAAAGVDLVVIEDPEAALSGGTALPVLHHPLPAAAVPGAPDPANAAAVVESIARGVDPCQVVMLATDEPRLPGEESAQDPEQQCADQQEIASETGVFDALAFFRPVEDGVGNDGLAASDDVRGPAGQFGIDPFRYVGPVGIGR